MNDFITFDTTNPTAIKVYSGELLKLVPEEDPVLSTPTEEFNFENPQIDAFKLKQDLIYSIKQYNGFGLSANQCGIPYSVFAMGYNNEFLVLFNPKIIEVSDQCNMMQEGCLSFPGLVLNIHRPNSVTISYQTSEGISQFGKLENLSARVVLHEMEHLQGIKFTSKAKPLALKNGLKRREKLFKHFAKELVKRGYSGEK